ncbi:MAG: peptidase domain-containing ABC transporter [Woeseiaceae bacterium]
MDGLDLSLFGRRRVPLVLQSERAECGLACVAMVAGYHGQASSLPELRARRPVSQKGAALPDLMAAARSLALECRALRVDLDELRDLSLPAILHWQLRHFVVLERVTARGVHIVDPASGRRFVPRGRCSADFSGVVLELSPAKDFARRSLPPRLAFADLLRGSGSMWSPLLLVLALSIAIQAFALLAPFYVQLAIDRVVPARDAELLLLLATGFGAIALINALAGGFRSWVVFYFGVRLNFRWTSGVFAWLLRLPLAWFEKRSIGDIQSRLASVAPLRELIASRAVEALVDGLMAATTGIVILFYGRRLALPVFAAVVLYAALRLTLFPTIRRRSRELIVASANAESCLLESLRGIAVLRNFGVEDRRSGQYRNRLADAFNASAGLRRASILQSVVETTILAMQNIVVVYAGISRVIDAKLTVGMLIAFLAYANHFTSRAISLLHSLLEFRLARVHLDRIADIVCEAPECPATTCMPHAAIGDGQCAPATIEVRGLGFRYAANEPWILRDVAFSVDAGESVAICAPSGSGKTTLLKVMTGMLAPDSGEVRYDRVPLRAENAAALRRRFGIVMQNDRLLAGTIAQNIAMFDDAPNMRRIVDCARQVGLHELVDRMPMNYLTLVGDMGDVFSGGQKQLVLLARALYRRPRILFLDEATSNLDLQAERRVASLLRRLAITRVVAAHRPETLAMCDRVIDLACVSGAGSAVQTLSLQPPCG